MPRISAQSVAEHRRKTAEKILDAVEEILEESTEQDGTAHLTVGTVAKRVGMGRSSLYRYHDNVNDMIEAVVVRDFPRRAKLITDEMDNAASPLEAIHAYALASFREARESRHSWRSSLSRLHLEDDARARIGRLHAELTHALAREVDELPDIPAELKPQLVSTIQSLINAGVTSVSSSQVGDAPEAIHGKPAETLADMQQREAQAATHTRAIQPMDTDEIEQWYVQAIDAVISAAQHGISRPSGE